MIPGIPQMGGEGDEGGNRLKRFMYMMDSMTDDELDGRVDLNRAPSRVDRARAVPGRTRWRSRCCCGATNNLKEW